MDRIFSSVREYDRQVSSPKSCRIRGKIKRRMWIRDNDLVLIAPWDFQSDKADIIWRYISAHAEKIKQDGHLQGLEGE